MTLVLVYAALDFYDSVKLVNYIRRQVEEKACVKCGEKQGSRKDLLDHMQKENHFAPTRDAEFWKNPQYVHTTTSPPLGALLPLSGCGSL
jgi:Zn ribbon nucleic-acid-binding protein